ncbi:hypothetical protein A0U40_09740 [[Bacillus] sp. KCTC 13219]|nr:hypothetical protein A0U40_09740 [[Bacillus] sp. KCTC 13219]
MEIKVNPQTKKFWLAYTEGWEPAYGHEIVVGVYSFSACVIKKGILVSEVTTGARVKIFPHNFLTMIMGATKEGALDYYEKFIAPTLVNVVENNENIEVLLANARNEIKKWRIGDMPQIENIDDSLIAAPISDVKH